MKICLLSRTFNLNGGIGRVSAELQHHLEARGHKVLTLSCRGESLLSYFKYTSLDLMRLPKGCDIYHALTPMEAIWIPKGRGVATILDVIALTHPDRYGGRLGYGKGVATFHDFFPLRSVGGAGLNTSLKQRIARSYYRFACEQALKCGLVTVISEHVRQELLGLFNVAADKIRVVRSGIREDLKPLPKYCSTLTFGYLGQLDSRKRVDILVSEFHKSQVVAELLIGGRGLDEKRLQLLAEKDPRIKFLGTIPEDRLGEFYNSLDVFVFPTAIEGYGLPPVEAMACRKPVVVLEDAIIPWEVKKRCVIVSRLEDLFNNHKYLTERLSYVDYDSNYAFAKEHNWDETAKKYVELYTEVLDGR